MSHRNERLIMAELEDFEPLTERDREIYALGWTKGSWQAVLDSHGTDFLKYLEEKADDD